MERALERQKKARQQAERILEAKSKELYDTTRQLRESNARLENLLNQKTSELEGVFVNILDPYVVMDLDFNILRMNDAAKEYLEFDYETEAVNLGELVHPDFSEYTVRSIKQLYEMGTLKNYHAKIFTARGNEKYVQINASVIYNNNNEAVAAQGIIRDITREQEAADLIQEQKQQLDIIVENSPLGIVLIADGKIIRLNSQFVAMTGYSREEVLHKPITDFALPISYSQAKKLMEQMNSGVIDRFQVDKIFTRKDGTTFHSNTAVSAVRNHEGKIGFLIGVIEDVTKQREAEFKLRASEKRMSSLIENLNTAVLLEDEHRRIALANKRFCQLFDVKGNPDSLKGISCEASASATQALFEDEAGFLPRVQQLLADRKLVQGEELRLKDGRIFERDYIPIIIEDTYMGHLWTYKDVTLRRLHRRQLEIEREKYSSIIANMNLGLLEVDENDHIQLVNQSFCQMSGFREEELLGKEARNVLRVDQPALIEVKNELRKNRLSDSYEVVLKDKQGRVRTWLISGAPRFDENGEFQGTIGIHLDITHLKELEAQKEMLLNDLQHSNRQLQEYAHVVSHDLKSPLRSIHALSTWLMEDYSDKLGDEGLVNLQLLHEKIEGMDRLITDILAYSSIHHNSAAEKTVNLNQVVNSIREIIFIPEHVRVVIMDDLPLISAIPAQMHQLFQNLMSNAVTHIENPEGLVLIGVREVDDFWEFYIRDNGVGIPAEYHEKIFQIFQTVSTHRKGSGIGLSIVKKIVEIYGGRVWLESAPGEGTTFYFTLKK